MDMLNADLCLAQKVEAKKRKGKGNSKKSKENDDDVSGFHFVTFVPINGCLWKLDGLERQPVNLGEVVAILR
jgi:ubiquitin carboxyl-terminal hydrolase L5